MTDLIPPQAIEVEEIVLAGLMTDSESYAKVQTIITPETFYLENHRIIFRAIKVLYDKGKPADLITVSNHLKTTGTLETIGGQYALSAISGKSVRATVIEHQARILAQTYIQRELIRIGQETASNGFDGSIDIEDQINQLKAKINEIENIASCSHSGNLQIDVLSRAIVEMEKDCENNLNGKPAGINTGLFLLDKYTGGWRDTNLIILAARPGVGKTSLALYFTKQAAKNGYWVNFYGLEMTSEDLMRIIIASESNIARTTIRDGKLSESDWNEINSVSSGIEKLPIVWYDNAGITAGQISANTRRNVKRGRCDMVIIDYLQLMSATDRKVNREQQISEITRSLKRTALEMKVSIICLSQLNREASEVKPQLHHLRESGAIEQDADIVIFPWRDGDQKYNLSIAKNRRGETGMFEIWANEEMTQFSNMSVNYPKRELVSRTETEYSPF